MRLTIRQKKAVFTNVTEVTKISVGLIFKALAKRGSCKIFKTEGFLLLPVLVAASAWPW